MLRWLKKYITTSSWQDLRRGKSETDLQKQQTMFLVQKYRTTNTEWKRVRDQLKELQGQLELEKVESSRLPYPLEQDRSN